MYESEKIILPEFPRTAHLPIEPNSGLDDIVASDTDLSVFLNSHIYVEEKIDGANMGISLYRGEPIIRNRTHILRKNYSKRKTPAQQQFLRVWTWYYANVEKWKQLNKILGFEAGVYGEWVYAKHVVHYDKLPSLFIAYDIYDAHDKSFLPTDKARQILQEAGFNIAPLLSSGIFTASELIQLRDGNSEFSSISQREGIYLKNNHGQRYKMVSPWFKSDDNWNKQQLIPNIIG